jgi:protein SCO1
MQTRLPIRRTLAGRCGLVLAGGVLGIAALAVTGSAFAQVSGYGDKQMGEPASDHLPSVLNKVSITQKLNQQIPLDGEYRDEAGKTVKLGDYFGKRPVIMALVYYQCPMLCSEELDGLVGALEMVKFKPGKEFDVVVVSIDPTEGPALAAKSKARLMKRYGRPETAEGWHLLSGGQQTSIDALANAVGFGYVRVPAPDGKMTQFAHASSIEILTPEGRLAQYYMGVEYSPKDINLGLVEASNHKIGSPVDAILTYCYHYDPTLQRHSLVIARVVQLGGLVTVLGLGSFMTVMFRRDIKEAKTGTGKNVNG